MCNMNPLPRGNATEEAIQKVRAEMAEAEEKVFKLIEANDGKLTFQDICKMFGWKMYEVSDALYGLDQRQGRIKQSSTDFSTCRFWVVEK